ncbi:sensor domain-containing protein [Demequina zhanjiangensis]|uniref:EAL domain-containing protein n=1 Tax=Demequina zhanjiangensis TaxID=3051659 RepID=A0ABT8G094_9MICO|nr:EAL domain-containing protein [Demequina sp. SYSU T00b26]MDN4472561.1 EAL domain-containing protein [Demequina sp. SYSU T00b26]
MSEPHASTPAHDADDAASRLAQLEAILQLAPVGIGLVDSHGRTTMTNGALHRMLGYTPEEFASLSWADYTHPDDVETNAEFSRQLAAGEIETFEMEKRFRRKDGGWVWTALTVSLVRKEDGTPAYEIGMTTDITERKRLESELRAAEERYRMLVERVPAVVYSAEPGQRGRWHYVSPQIEEMLGFTAQEWIADPELWWNQVDPADRDRLMETEAAMLAEGPRSERRGDTYRMFRRDGTPLWVRDDSIVLYDQAGRPMIQGVIVDVTQEKALEAKLGHDAYHDALTGLPNRTLFRDRVAEALSEPVRGEHRTVVLFIDLDNFKAVNDTFGHATGDEVVVAAARRIRSSARENDIAARLGGDEFAVMLTHSTAEEAEALANRILNGLQGSPIAFSGGTALVGASIGIAIAEHGETTETLLRNADLAMYQAKARGRGRHVTYESDMHQGAVAQFKLDEALQLAVAAGTISLAFQPIADLGTGRVVGVEALARWYDANLGVVPPSVFIPAAEQAGLIHELGRQVLVRACTELVQWRDMTGNVAFVTVNVSPLQFEDELFPEFVMTVLEDRGLEPASLILEVTEGLLLEECSRDTLATLRAGGIRVAIDDFGTGYSSLSYLRDLPVDMIKIDQAFVGLADSSDSDRDFLGALIGLVRTLSLTPVAEGIETQSQLAEVRATGCAYGQGYLLARPGPMAMIPAVIENIAENAHA